MITEAETPQEAEAPTCSFEVAAADSESRLALAKEIGKFLRRAVAGQPRGSSGRDRLKLQNRCYLVVADFEGKLFAEPKFLTSFQEVKAICKRGSEAGDSVFVGLPTKWEARAALIAGDFPLPAALRHAWASRPCAWSSPGSLGAGVRVVNYALQCGSFYLRVGRRAARSQFGPHCHSLREAAGRCSLFSMEQTGGQTHVARAGSEPANFGGGPDGVRRCAGGSHGGGYEAVDRAFESQPYHGCAPWSGRGRGSRHLQRRRGHGKNADPVWPQLGGGVGGAFCFPFGRRTRAWGDRRGCGRPYGGEDARDGERHEGSAGELSRAGAEQPASSKKGRSRNKKERLESPAFAGPRPGCGYVGKRSRHPRGSASQAQRPARQRQQDGGRAAAEASRHKARHCRSTERERSRACLRGGGRCHGRGGRRRPHRASRETAHKDRGHLGKRQREESKGFGSFAGWCRARRRECDIEHWQRQSSSLQKAGSLPPERPCLHLRDGREPAGERLQCDAQCTRRLSPEHFGTSLVGAQVEAGQLCSHDQIHLDPMWNLGCLAERGGQGGQGGKSSSSARSHSSRPDLHRRRQLASVSGSAVGRSAADEQFSAAATSRPMGPAQHSPAPVCSTRGGRRCWCGGWSPATPI